jgi:hypothetical protein
MGACQSIAQCDVTSFGHFSFFQNVPGRKDYYVSAPSHVRLRTNKRERFALTVGWSPEGQQN